MNEQLLNEIGERLKNGEDLLSIKADLISQGVNFDQFEVYSKPQINKKVEYNFVYLIQKYIIGFTFIFGFYFLFFCHSYSFVSTTWSISKLLVSW